MAEGATCGRTSPGAEDGGARWLHPLGAMLCLLLAGCPRAPPPSQFPTARDAIERMRGTYACSRGLQGESRVDFFGERGRVRGSALFVVSRPERVRLDVFSPLGAVISTLTSDGDRFALLDFQAKEFWQGPATTCNVERFVRVPVPPHALVRILTGEAPVLVHEPGDATIEWASGRYVIRVVSRHAARQEIHLEPHPADWERPWREQRVRVSEISVSQADHSLYRAELRGHAAAPTAGPRVDPEGIDPDLLPSGPPCDTEVPQRVRFVVPGTSQDVIFSHQEVVHNPPLVPGVFAQTPPPGVVVRFADCRAR